MEYNEVAKGDTVIVTKESLNLKEGDLMEALGEGRFLRMQDSTIYIVNARILDLYKKRKLHCESEVEGDDCEDEEEEEGGLTPSEDRGYKIGDVFIVTQDTSYFKRGDIITLSEDDKTHAPYFSIEGGGNHYPCSLSYVALYENKVDTPCESRGYKVGEEFIVNRDTLYFEKDDIIRLVEDDETDAPFFVLKGDLMNVIHFCNVSQITKYDDTDEYGEYEDDTDDNDEDDTDGEYDIYYEDEHEENEEYIEEVNELNDLAQKCTDTLVQDFFLLIPGSSIVIAMNGSSYVVDASHTFFDAIVALCTQGDFKAAVALSEPAKAITEFSQGEVEIKGNAVMYKGEEVNDGLTEAIMRLMKEGDTGFKKLVAFFNRIEENPSYKSRLELFKYIKAADIEITEAGNLVCWKVISLDWTDCRTGTFDNSIGAIPSMPREDVDDNSNNLCSEGLHACSRRYITEFYGSNVGNRLKVVKVLVNPKNVVSIPTDYNDSKMRVCKYEVIEEVTDQFTTRDDY